MPDLDRLQVLQGARKSYTMAPRPDGVSSHAGCAA
jgi:hypothetical protein